MAKGDHFTEKKEREPASAWYRVGKLRDTLWLNGVTWGPITAIVVSLFIYFAAQYIGSLVIDLYPIIRHWGFQQTDIWLGSITAQFAFFAVVEGLTIAGVGLYVYKRAKGTFRTIGLVRPKWHDLGYAMLGFLVYFPAVTLVMGLVKGFIPALNLSQPQKIGFAQAAGGSLVFVFIALVLLPPLAEEILVRGFLYLGLKKGLRTIPAALVTSALFGIAHLEFGSGAPLLWPAAIDTFILSLVLIYLREREGSLWPSIFLHMTKNCIAFMSLFVFVAR